MDRLIETSRVLTDNGAIASRGDNPVQFLIEVMAAVVVWAAAFAFNQFGVEVDLARPPAAEDRPTVQRSPQAAAAPASEAASDDCPDSKKAAVHRI